MGCADNQRSTETLADWLSQLRAGDPCPCCGAELEAVPAGRISKTQGSLEELLCSQCGCEVAVHALPFKQAGRQVPCSAALCSVA